MAKCWRVLPHEPERIAALGRALGVSSIVAQLLLNRGVSDPRQAQEFLDAKLKSLNAPSLLPGAEEAAERIYRAARAGRRIVVYGDYDVDGICATSILWECLKLAGASVEYYVPDRLEEGYGLNADAIRALAAKAPGLLLVTVDCGIGSLEEAELARQLGVELIVTDHHEFGAVLPAAAAIVHPRLPGGSYPFGGLCGAGVAFKLAWAICQRFSQAKQVSPPMRNFLVDAVSLAALGTVADVVPLQEENRVLVRHGLAGIRAKPSVGLRALMEVSGLADKDELTASDVGFVLAPRLNAAGRLGQARLAVELLTTRDPHKAQELAQLLHRQNEQRQQLERQIFQEAREQVEAEHDLERPGAIVLAHAAWHPGVIGIVASRLAERYYRPAILISLKGELGQGSARSIPGFHLYNALHHCREHLVGYGGHAAAAGLRIRTSELDRFRVRFCAHVAEQLGGGELTEQVTVDAEVALSNLTLRLVDEIERLAPFGAGNPRPLLMLSGTRLVGDARTMGNGERHLMFRVRQKSGAPLRAVAWRQAERAKELSDGRLCSLLFTPKINRWQGNVSVELEVREIRLDESDE